MDRVAGAEVGPRAPSGQPTTPFMWWVGAVSTAVSAGAAVQLLVLTTRTEEFFAWTITIPASAAFLGLFYLASAVMGVLALRQPRWAPARAALLPVMAFVGFVLVVTLVHLEVFHLAADGLLARAAAWIWLVVYLVTPPAYALAWWRQARAPGAEQIPGQGMPRWAWRMLAVLGAPMAALGPALLVRPLIVEPYWPWPLTELTGRMIGATVLAVALLVGSVLWVDDRTTGRIAAIGLAVCGVWALVVPVGYGGDAVRWSEPSAWVYLTVCALLVGVVLAGHLGARGGETPGSGPEVKVLQPSQARTDRRVVEPS